MYQKTVVGTDKTDNLYLLLILNLLLVTRVPTNYL